MDKELNDYAAFERVMDERRIYRLVRDFSEICSIIGADPVSLDMTVYEELGWRGQDLVDYYRRCENIHLSD